MLRTQDKRLFLGDRLDGVTRTFAQPVHEFLGPSGTSGGVSVTPNASANTKSTNWVEIGTSTVDCDGFYLQINAGEVADDYLVDLAAGAAASEVLFLSNFLISATPGATGFGDPVGVYIPLGFPGGTRFSSKAQVSQAAGAAVSINLVLASGEEFHRRRKSRATTYGANTADSGGTSIDPGGSANADGSWVQLSAAITNPIESLVACIGNLQNTARTTASWRFDLGIGAALSETVVVPQGQLRATDVGDMVRPLTHERTAFWPAGSRLSARARCSTTDATDRLFDLVVIGFD